MYEVLLDGKRIALCNSQQLAESYVQSTPGATVVGPAARG